MSMTLYSLLAATLWSSFFIVILYLCRRSTAFVVRFGSSPLLILIAGCLIRCFLPLDLPPFTRVIALTDSWLSQVDRFLYRPLPGMPPWFCPLNLLGIVWLAGIVFLLGRLAWSYFICVRKVRGLKETQDPRMRHLLAKTCQRLRVSRVRLVQSDADIMPALVGSFPPTLLLPDIPYTDGELEFVFTHELTHWKNRDLWVKLLVELFCAVFWWNPLSCLLRKDLIQTLELKCDLAVTSSLTEEGKVEYLETILKALRHRTPKRSRQPLSVASAELSGVAGADHAVQRFEMILHYKPNPWRARRQAALASFVVMLALVFSYAFVVQPGFTAPKAEIEANGCTQLTPENSYLVLTANGEYFLHSKAGRNRIPVDMAKEMQKSGFPLIEK